VPNNDIIVTSVTMPFSAVYGGR